MSKITVGIDLGTTNTVCCYFENKVEFLNFRGKDTLPSVLYYNDGKITVGVAAKKRAIMYPECVIKSSKTYLGDDNKIWEIKDESFTPTQVACEILKEVYKNIQSTYNVSECAAVITVPAYFTAKQYRETEIAAERAGFEVIQILSEPVAAAVAYGAEDGLNQSVFIADLGGGTFDVSILDIKDNTFQTISVNGDRKLGGDNFNQVLVELCMSKLRKEYGINLSSHEKSGLESSVYHIAVNKLYQECEKRKEDLSILDETTITIPSLLQIGENTINFQMDITQSQFVEASEPLLTRIKDIINECFLEKGRSVTSIDKVILVGGSSNIPCVQELIKGIFKSELYSDKDLSKLVALGAAMVAADDSKLVTESKVVIKDILSHSLGIEIAGGKYDILLEKNQEYPLEITKVYTTTENFQQKMEIRVFEGECKEDISKNFFYDEYELEGIERAKKGIPKIHVTFALDENKILRVDSIDVKTKARKQKQVQIN